MVAWPSELKILRSGYSETLPSGVIRSDMDFGPSKIRKRTSANVRVVTFSLFLTDAESIILEEFYQNHAAVSFDFTNPRTGSVVRARFKSEPKLELNDTYWSVDVELEILP